LRKEDEKEKGKHNRKEERNGKVIQKKELNKKKLGFSIYFIMGSTFFFFFFPKN
jgi:hypothetical protein